MNPDPVVKLTKNEGLKANSPTLEGTIATSLQADTDHFSDEDYEFLKFHGVYQQDDRDKRKTGKQYIMMVRTRFPGGVLTGQQYAVCDELASRYGNGTLRITTRQDFQFHGILKSNLKQSIKELNQALMTTIAACGDVARNVMAPPTPATSPIVNEILEQARQLSWALAPKTKAYHSIWLDGAELTQAQPFGQPVIRITISSSCKPNSPSRDSKAVINEGRARSDSARPSPQVGMDGHAMDASLVLL